jgi:hypothetical protein
MAYRLPDTDARLPKVAASAIRAGEPVRSSASSNNQVLPVGTAVGVRVLGVALATAASPGDAVAVDTQGVVVARACASIGPGALVSIGSTNGRLALAVSASSHEVVGESQVAAADGDWFSVLLNPTHRTS